MIKRYDMILLLVAFALTIGSYSYYLQLSKQLPHSITSIQQSMTDALVAVVVQPYERRALHWQVPKPQDEEGLWLFDLFTPPKIWWDVDKQEFVAHPPYSPAQPSPFGLELVAIERVPYRIQFDAFFGNMGDANEALVQLYDHEKKQTCRGSVGMEFPNSAFKILGCNNCMHIQQDGTRATITQVTLLDTRTQEHVTLNSAEQHYVEGAYDITFVTSAPPYGTRDTFVLQFIGDTFKIAHDTFTLMDFSFSNQTATLKKLTNPNKSPTTKTLISSAIGSEEVVWSP